MLLSSSLLLLLFSRAIHSLEINSRAPSQQTPSARWIEKKTSIVKDESRVRSNALFSIIYRFSRAYYT